MSKVENKMDAKDWERVDPDIVYTGKAITLPETPQPMPLRVAAKALIRKAEDEDTIMDVQEVINAYPEDALVALHAVMKDLYGWASAKPQMSFFGPVAPDLVTIKTGPFEDDFVQVVSGSFTLPNVENEVRVFPHRNSNGPCLYITGEVRKREAIVVKELASRTRDYLKTNSIYRGKSIRMKVDEDGKMDMSAPPIFLRTDNIAVDDLILNDDEQDQVNSSIWAPVRNTEMCVKHGIPLNRGALLEGTYGTGKTMTAHATSRVCTDNGWTFIMLDDVRGLAEALTFAQRYQPAVVFAEDVDRVADKRDQAGNDLLNTIDGVLTKNAKVITVLTTNHVERLNKAMLRPGRLDAVISVRPPEGTAVERLVRLYARDLLAADEDLTSVVETMGGNIPATIREIVERSKLSMVADGRNHLTATNLMVAAKGMENHLELLKDAPETPSLEESLGNAVVEAVRKGADPERRVQVDLNDLEKQARKRA